MKVWDRTGIELGTPGSAVRHASVAESRGGSANKPLGSCGVNHRDAHAYLQLSDINIQFAKKKIDHLFFYLCFVFYKG